MLLRNKRIYSLVLALLMLVGIMIPSVTFADAETVKITILGTTDLHANIYNWSYEDGKETEDFGMAKVYSVVKKVREENPNTLLIDNGDTIQGTILSDDLYNFNLELKHPVIDVMNFMGYDSFTLGNHEFNFGLEMVKKIKEEAKFPILAANANYKEDGSYLVEPYVIKEVGGVKVGILGLTNPNIPRWDGPKVGDLEFATPVESAEKHIKEMKEKGVDLIILSTHMGYTSEYGGDGADEIIAKFPEVAAVITGHGHVTENQKVGNTLVGAARNEGRQVVRFDFELTKKDNTWVIVDSKVDIIEVKEYEASTELKEYAKGYHDKTLDFLVDVIGTASADFAPASEIPGIPEAQLKDTAVIDLINDVQLKATGADVAGAALFASGSNLRAGDITYASIFEIYKYPNTLVGVEVTGAELKAYMEWSAAYYNTFVPGDINLSFNPKIRVYNYDMFQGVDYKVDVSKPEGERIVDLKLNGELLKETDTLKLAINNYRYGGLMNMGIISGEPYFESDPKSLRSYIADYIAEQGVIEPKVDNNWEVIGADFNHPLRDYIIGEIKAGNIEIPKSEDGRTVNVKAINAIDMIEGGLIPEEVLKANMPVAEEYVVKPGDVLWKIAKMYNTTWEKLAEYNNLKNPHLIFPNQVILVK
ncbi:5'-nucleotidase C-terminal domain-containing protein [Tissierella sp.]|uniref:5'-nucleotidase C-terminal domain-containing protein n=1 Tax=Tissierella sp. TaxID=41274 RepID=UPI0028645C9D|nr:5'-nucleotidase C-terminal domain-containing protein [Tissierella sp.]MDR7857008.1 5'-nucleotidase C-terminal domain-containing protein [Tissierella sp.]